MTPTPDTELMACPNPWCSKSRPVVGKMHGCLWAVRCASCDLYAPTEDTAAEAIAAWNCRDTRIASTPPADSPLMDDLTKLAIYADHAGLGRADRDVIAAIYSRLGAALRQQAPRADDALREALKPFAEQAEEYDARGGEHAADDEQDDWPTFKVSDFRRARAALASDEPTDAAKGD